MKNADREFKIPSFADVQSASERIKDEAVRTPLLKSPFLDFITGANVFLKPETLQRTGSFKFRGAYNAISALSPEIRKAGVLAVSSGNHAQGVAEAARLHGISSTIIMPSDAPVTKVERTKRSGAEVILYDRINEDREKLAVDTANQRGIALIHPFNDPFVIAGQGTVGLEICQDLREKSEIPDHVLVCTGGGGLTAGTALSVSHYFASAICHSCEPQGFDDYRRSLVSGKRETNEKKGGSICDAVITPSPGEIGFEINRELLGEGFAVSDEQALAAVAFAYRELKLVVEPGGAVALASLMTNKDVFKGKTVVAILSGGNIDPEVLQKALA